MNHLIPILTQTQLFCVMYASAGICLGITAAALFEYGWTMMLTVMVLWPLFLVYGICYITLDAIIHIIGVRRCQRWAMIRILWLALKLGK